ncbi:MAG: hypothetical protein ACREBW_07845 [Candidatus Micrarchaeaceae archaeon]
MNWLKRHYTRLLIGLAFVLIIVHGFFDGVFKVDNISIFLLIILALLPFLPLVRKIKWGEFEAEISKAEIDKIEEKALEVPEKAQSKISPVSKVESLTEITEKDPVLGLAKARIEIEKRIMGLGQIYLSRQAKRVTNLRSSIQELVSADVFSAKLGALLIDVVAVANRAIHGESVSPDNAIRLAGVSAKAINELDEVVLEHALKSASSETITPAAMKSFSEGRYVLKTVVPYVKNPEIRTYHLNQPELDRLLSSYDEYAEFIVSLEKE